MIDSKRIFHGLVLFAFALMAAIVLLSAYMRLSNAGLGCLNWPECYGRNLSGYISAHPAWMTALHRLAASLMSMALLALAVLALRRRRESPGRFPRVLMLFGFTVFLAGLGKWAPSPLLPAVVLGNMLAGLGMLVLLWRLHLDCTVGGPPSSRPSAQMVLGIGLLVMQIVLGGMVSANFAALGCTGLLSCDGWQQGMTLAAFNPLQSLIVEPGSQFVSGTAQQAIHMTHRLFAPVVFIYLSWLGVGLLREKLRSHGQLLLAVLILQALLGICSVVHELPLFLVLMHNATAACLLLILVTISYRTRMGR